MNTAAAALLTLLLLPPAAAQSPDGGTLHPDVQQLLAHETRTAAMARILARGEYRGPGSYRERGEAFRVGHVVLCPQPQGPPLLAVFGLGLGHERAHRPAGHLVTVAADGVVVRCWQGNNVVDQDEVFADVNGDGIVERVGVMNCGVGEDGGGGVRQLFVTPITAAVTATLRVAFAYRDGRLGERAAATTAWRVVPARGDEAARVQIGPVDPDTGEPSEVTAEWRWLAERRAWVGPGGGPNRDFVRLPPEGWDGLREFARAQRARHDRRDR